MLDCLRKLGHPFHRHWFPFLLSAILLFHVRTAGFSALCSPLLLIVLQSTRLVIVADSNEEAWTGRPVLLALPRALAQVLP